MINRPVDHRSPPQTPQRSPHPSHTQTTPQRSRHSAQQRRQPASSTAICNSPPHPSPLTNASRPPVSHARPQRLPNSVLNKPPGGLDRERMVKIGYPPYVLAILGFRKTRGTIAIMTPPPPRSRQQRKQDTLNRLE